MTASTQSTRPWSEVEDTTIRDAMRHFPAGVAVVSTPGEQPHGMTANSLTCVSLEPPVVLICVREEATLHARLTSTQWFGISLLAGSQEHVAAFFASSSKPRGAAQFAEVSSTQTEHGVPLIDDALAWIECEKMQAIPCGDHSIFLGKVTRCAAAPHGRSALLYFRGEFDDVSER